MPGKYGSNRVGWNQRGPGIRDQMADAIERSNPESYYWQNKTKNVKLALIEAMGDVDFVAFAESTFPGQVIDGFTWQQIYKTYASKLAEVQGSNDG